MGSWSGWSHSFSALVRKLGGQLSDVLQPPTPNGTSTTEVNRTTSRRMGGNLHSEGGDGELASEEEGGFREVDEGEVVKQPEEVRVLVSRLREELEVIKACQGGRIW